MRALLLRHLGVGGLLLGFTAVDAVGAWIVLQLAGQPYLGLAAAAAATAIALFGYRADGPAWRGGLALAVVIGLVIALPQIMLISEQTPNSPLHDGILLTDAAGRLLLSGQDPYGHDYVDSAARTFYLSDVPVNFGLDHYVYMPAMVLLDLPIRALNRTMPTANFSWMFLPALLALAGAAWSLGATRAAAHGYLVAVVLNPLFQLDYLYFLNDLFFLAPLLAAVALIRRDRPGLAGAAFALALDIKQQAVLLLPLTAWYCWLHWNDKRWHRAFIGFGGVALPVILPFLFWNPAAFLSDTTAFFFGSGVHAYPIRGLGLPGLLLRSGVIVSRWDPFPWTSMAGAVVALAVVAVALRDLHRRFDWTRFWVWNGVLTLAVFAFGRVLAPNYLDLAATLLLIGLVSWLVDRDPLEVAAVDQDRTPGDRGVPVPA